MILFLAGALVIGLLTALTIGSGLWAYRLFRPPDGSSPDILGASLLGTASAVLLILLLVFIGMATGEITTRPPDGCYRLTTVSRSSVMVTSTGKTTTVIPYTYNDQEYDPIPCP